MKAPVDGIICFGGVDYWYHNRGHYDPQMMRYLSNKIPVVYINSIGMQAPKRSEGRMFWTRVKRKLKSLARGFRRVDHNFGVCSLISLPAGGKGWSAPLNARLLTLQAKLAGRLMGIRNPAIWFACPPAAQCLPHLQDYPKLYQRTDRFESFHGVDSAFIAGCDRDLKAAADLVLFCSTTLFEAERDQCQKALFVDHGVDFDEFSRAGRASIATIEPDDVVSLPKPRVGFVGGIDIHTFDPELYKEVVRLLPDYHFLLVGGCSLPEGWIDAPNVRLVGRKEYTEVPEYMAACDVLIMPWTTGSWIEACNPVKMKEYLAVGRPVVSTYFPEVRRFEEFIAVAKDPAAFAAAIQQAIENPGSAEEKRERVKDENWASKADEVWNAINNV